jgi:Ca-activated chloride channel family protein
LAVPVAGLAYAARERRRSTRAPFASAAMAASVAPRRAGWRRHAPFIVYGLALAALIVALARPQTTVAVEVEQATVVLVTDRSGSMAATDVRPTRLEAARRAADRFLDQVPRRMRVAAVAFNQRAGTVQAPTTDRQAIREAYKTLTPRGGTATGDAVDLALRLARPPKPPGAAQPPAAIVLISDGASVRGRDPVDAARAARKARVPIFTIALGTPDGTIRVPRRGGGTETRRVPPDPATLKRMAEVSGGRSFTVADSEELAAVYQRLGSQVARKHEKREVTAAAAGGALALVLLAGGMSLAWFGRLP